MRTQSMTLAPQHGGQQYGKLSETRQCGTKPCAGDCVASPWGVWGKCSAKCGDGIKTRTRKVLKPARFGGAECGFLSEKTSCRVRYCPQDCKVSAWGTFGKCSK